MAEKVFIVKSPVKDFCGVGAAGIHFANGEAEVREGWVLDWFKEHGYEITPKDADPLDGMKVDELKAFAEANNINIGAAKNKAEILEILKNHQ